MELNKMTELSFIVESVHGEDREEIGRAKNEKDAWIIARKWIDKQFNSPKIYYVRKWYISVNRARYDFGSHTWFIDITDSNLKAFDVTVDYRNPPQTSPIRFARTTRRKQRNILKVNLLG